MELTKKELRDGKLYLTFRTEKDSGLICGNGRQPPEVKVWRETYACSNGVVVLKDVEHAVVTPARMEEVPERIEWRKPLDQ